MSSDPPFFSTLPLRRIQEDPFMRMDRAAWPATLAPVGQLLDEGIDLGPVTILVGDNGAGKSESIGDAGIFHERSHGESFLDLVMARSRVRGLWMLDEPESALSLPGCLALIGLLRDLVAEGSQIIVSTHSPVLAAYPGGNLYEIGEWGIRASAYDELDLVVNWRSFLDAPERFLRHLL